MRKSTINTLIVAVLAVIFMAGTLIALPLLQNPQSYECATRYEAAKANARTVAQIEGKSQDDIKAILAALDQQEKDDQECKARGFVGPTPTPGSDTPTPSASPEPTASPAAPSQTPSATEPSAPWYHWYTTEPGKTHGFNFGPPAPTDTDPAVTAFREAIRKDPSQTCIQYQVKVKENWPIDNEQFNDCVRDLMGNQAKANQMADEIDDHIASQRVIWVDARTVDTYTMVMVDGVPHILSFDNATRHERYAVLETTSKSGHVTHDRLECFFQPEVVSEQPAANEQPAQPRAAQPQAAQPQAAQQPHVVAPTSAPRGNSGGTPLTQVAAPPPAPECVNGGVPDKNGKCIPPVKREKPEVEQPPHTQQPSEKPHKPQPSERPTTTSPTQPSEKPSQKPSQQPSHKPTPPRTQQPSHKPSQQPSHKPSQQPTPPRTQQPSQQPSQGSGKKPSEDVNANPKVDDFKKSTDGSAKTSKEDGSKSSTGLQQSPQAEATRAAQKAQQSQKAQSEKHEKAKEDASSSGAGKADDKQDNGSSGAPPADW